MGRQKGSVNKKKETVQLEFADKLNIEKETGVFMATEAVLEEINVEIDQARLELEKTKREIEAKKQELASIATSSGIKDAPSAKIENKSLLEKIAAQKAYDNQPVTGKFYNLRAKGMPAKLTYNKYADDPVKWYTFEHGQVYTIPRGFADQISEHYYTPHFIQKEGAAAVIADPNNPGSGLAGIDTRDKMYSFVPLSF